MWFISEERLAENPLGGADAKGRENEWTCESGTLRTLTVKYNMKCRMGKWPTYFPSLGKAL